MEYKNPDKALPTDQIVDSEKAEDGSFTQDFPEAWAKKAIEQVTQDKEESLSFYEVKFKRFNYFDAVYERGTSKKNAPFGRANLRLPQAFQQIEPFVCSLTETMVGEAPYIAYQGQTVNDDAPAADITDYTQYQMDQGDFLKEQTMYFRNLGKYGTAVMKVVWDRDVEPRENTVELSIPMIDPLTGQMIMDPMTGQPVIIGTAQETVVEDTIVFDGPRFHNISIYDFFVPPSASSCNVQKLSHCIHRTYRTPEQLLKNPNYKNRNQLLKLCYGEEHKEANAGSDLSNKDSAKKTQVDQNTDGKSTEKFKGKLEVLEWWGDFKFAEDTYLDNPEVQKKQPVFSEPALIVVALPGDGDPILLRCEPNPLQYKFKPFTASNDYPIEGEFYGYGELHHTTGLMEESGALRNARLDIANMSLNKAWVVDRNAGVNTRDMTVVPNKVFYTNDMSGLRQLEMSGVTASSVEELSRIDFDIQNTTEIINPRQDVSSVGAAFGGTATGVNFLSARSNLRLLTKARLLEQTHFKEIAMIMLKYNRQFTTTEQYFRSTDKSENPFKVLPADAFESEVDFKPSSNPQKLTRDEKKANMEYLLQTLGQIEKVIPGSVNFYEFLPEVFKLAGFPHPDKYVNPPVTQVMQTPDGQLVDSRGQPVQVIPPEETPQGGQQNG